MIQVVENLRQLTGALTVSVRVIVREIEQRRRPTRHRLIVEQTGLGVITVVLSNLVGATDADFHRGGLAGRVVNNLRSMRGAVNGQVAQTAGDIVVLMHQLARLRAVAVFGWITHVGHSIKRVIKVIRGEGIRWAAGQRQGLRANAVLRIVTVTLSADAAGTLFN